MTSPTFPEPPPAIAPTPLMEVDAKVHRLATRKAAWLDVTLAQRIDYLRRARAGVAAVAERWVEGGCRLKGFAPDDVLAGEEWIAGPWQVARNIRLLIHALEHRGQPSPAKTTARSDGRHVVRVFPLTLEDKILFSGFVGEVWTAPGGGTTQGAIYREPKPAGDADAKGAKGIGQVALVLGAGNVSSIAPMDALYKLFVENEVVLLKMNPVNAHVGPRLEEAFHALIDDGYLAIVYGGAEVGKHLANHAEVDTLHVTGSDRTYDAIVWGASPEEQARRKAASDPVNKRPFTAELGCVTPVLVVPGPWSLGDMEFQARQVAGMVAQNASFNCNAAKVIITAKGWLQRETFLRKVEEELAKTRARKAYYPGAQDRYREFLAHYPNARAVGPGGGDDVVPWTLIPDVPPEKGEHALTSEAFCGVLAEVSLDAKDAPSFLAKAVPFANERCWGTLSCCMLVHPATTRDHGAEVDEAIAQLRYGGIGVNCWPAIVYGLVSTTWGAFPGHSTKDIQSGTGVVHNALLFDHPEKSVVRAPFRIWPTPVWFADHKNLAAVGKKLTALEIEPGFGNVVRVALAAMKG
jgi:acyl-CoA reductase-like NAD-dependent aldehyde dehydrogenase